MAPQAPPQTGSPAARPGATTAPRIPLHVRRYPSSEASHSFAVTLKDPDTADMPGIRRRVRAFLADRRMTDSVLDNVLLVVSELLTNAVLHALPPAMLHIHCDDQAYVRIEVSDGGPRLTPETPESEEEHGRGLCIVAALCVSHGTFTHRQGATHWARVGS